MPHARLRCDYRTQYHAPIGFERGESVQVDRRDTEWPEFLWATDPHGRSGWVHQRYLDRDTGQARAIRDYSARELDAKIGERVQLLDEAGGWWWCENSDGAQGWLPARDLDIESA